MNTKRSTKLIAATAIGFALALGAPLAASAHVTVSPVEAEPGSYALLTFRVPNESDTAGTIEVAVDLPQDTPFASVSYEAIPGWSATVERTQLAAPAEVNGTEVTEAATRVVWKADEGVQIAPGEFQRFALSVGPVPEVESIVLAATQTYSDGDVVAWADTDPEGEYPAPVLYATGEPADDHHSGSHTDEADDAAATESASSSDDGLARGLGIAGLIAGALALVLAAFAVFRRKA